MGWHLVKLNALSECSARGEITVMDCPPPIGEWGQLENLAGCLLGLVHTSLMSSQLNSKPQDVHLDKAEDTLSQRLEPHS